MSVGIISLFLIFLLIYMMKMHGTMIIVIRVVTYSMLNYFYGETLQF